MAYKLSGTQTDAEDIVQDALFKLFPKLDELEQVEDLNPWLKRVVYNQFVDHTRRQKRNPVAGAVDEEVLDFNDEHERVDTPVEPEQALLQQRQSEQVMAALDSLDRDRRSLIVMHMMEGYTLEELTGVFDVPLGTLKSRLHRTKAELKKQLGAEPFGESQRVGDRGHIK